MASDGAGVAMETEGRNPSYLCWAYYHCGWNRKAQKTRERWCVLTTPWLSLSPSLSPSLCLSLPPPSLCLSVCLSVSLSFSSLSLSHMHTYSPTPKHTCRLLTCVPSLLYNFMFHLFQPCCFKTMWFYNWHSSFKWGKRLECFKRASLSQPFVAWCFIFVF